MNIHYDVNPRHTSGSPAMVDARQALRVAQQEVEAFFALIRFELKAGAKIPSIPILDVVWRQRLRGIVENSRESRRDKGWVVTDLITGEVFLRLFEKVCVCKHEENKHYNQAGRCAGKQCGCVSWRKAEDRKLSDVDARTGMLVRV